MIRLKTQCRQNAVDQRHAAVLRRARCRLVSAIATLFGVLSLGGAPQEASAVVINLDTTSLAGTPAVLDFSLIDGDGLPNNSITISSIVADVPLGNSVCVVGCSGGPPFTVDDAGGFGQFLQYLTLGDRLTLDLSFTGNFSGFGAPDRLALSLLDPASNFTLVDSDLDFASDPVPVQDALLIVDYAPGAPIIRLASASNPSLPLAIPEPGVGALFPFALALLGGQRIRRGAPRVSSKTLPVAASRFPQSTQANTGE